MTWADAVKAPSAATIARLYPHLGVYVPEQQATDTDPPVLQLPQKLSFLFEPWRYKVAYGGRGGTKSWGFAKVLLLLGAMQGLRILCAREFQVSIAESVHKLLSDQIAADPWYAARYDVQKTVITNPTTGTTFTFSGIRNNVTKIKSMEGIDIVWVEEAEKVSDYSWQVLIPTIRKTGSEIWVSFNPDEETDPTSRRFLTTQPPRAKVVKIGWEDNPWLPDELREEKDYLYRIDPEAAEHVWGGGFRKNSAAQIFRGKYKVEGFIPEPTWDGPYYGADWGFSQDPTTLVKLFIYKNTLYVYEEAYGVGVDIDDTPEMFDGVRGARAGRIRADNARPETISYMQRHGYPNVVACTKWDGSVEDGIAFLRSFECIVIHPRCKHAAEEARLYSYKVDRLTKEPLNDIEDKHNHIWDAIRYALEPIIRAAKRGMLDYMKNMKAEAEAEAKAIVEQKRTGPWR